MKVTLDTFRDLGGAFIAALVLVIYYKSFAISGIILLGSFLSYRGDRRALGCQPLYE